MRLMNMGCCGRRSLLKTIEKNKHEIDSLFRSSEWKPCFIWIIFLLLVSCIVIDKFRTKLSTKKTTAFVITLPGKDSRLPKVLELFKTYANLNLYPYYGINGNTVLEKIQRYPLTPGQRGLRETMKQFFNMTIAENYDEVLVFQDDAIPHKNFSYLYANMPQRCQEADVLLLGASMWHQTKKQWPKDICFDVDRFTFGAYGLLVKKSAFHLILVWLDKLRFKTFDNIFRYLRKSNLKVRVAYPPFLVIMDVSHESLINNHRNKVQFNITARARIHNWHLENYPIAAFS